MSIGGGDRGRKGEREREREREREYRRRGASHNEHQSFANKKREKKKVIPFICANAFDFYTLFFDIYNLFNHFILKWFFIG
jgi:hypothetical protein